MIHSKVEIVKFNLVLWNVGIVYEVFGRRIFSLLKSFENISKLYFCFLHCIRLIFARKLSKVSSISYSKWMRSVVKCIRWWVFVSCGNVCVLEERERERYETEWNVTCQYCGKDISNPRRLIKTNKDNNNNQRLKLCGYNDTNARSHKSLQVYTRNTDLTVTYLFNVRRLVCVSF